MTGSMNYGNGAGWPLKLWGKNEKWRKLKVEGE
jgi:hypothetical protein